MTPTRYRWFIVFLLFTITGVNYIDRAAISYAIPAMQRDLGLSPGNTGTILGAFGLGYALTTLFGGFAVDRYGARIVLPLPPSCGACRSGRRRSPAASPSSTPHARCWASLRDPIFPP